MWQFLLTAAAAQCRQSLPPQFPNNTTEETTPVYEFSGRTVTDLGDIDGCESEPEYWYLLVQSEGEPRPVLGGLCAPKACNLTAVQDWLSETGGQVARTVAEGKMDTGAGIALTVICVLALLVIYATFRDWKYRTRRRPAELVEIPLVTFDSIEENPPQSPVLKSSVSPYLASFSALRSAESLISTDEREATLAPLDILKSVSLVSLICASVFYTRYFGPSINPSAFTSIATHWLSLGFVHIGAFAFDCFLWSTAVLYTWKMLQRWDSGDGIGYCLVLKKRVARTLPVLAVVLLADALVVPALGRGPLWHRADIATRDCSEYWWTVLTYTSNILPSGLGNNCLEVAWYYALDLQQLIQMPIFLFLAVRCPHSIWWLPVILTPILCALITCSLSDYYQFTVALTSMVNYRREFILNVLAKSYSHFGVTMFGMASGVLAFTSKSRRTCDRLTQRILAALQSTPGNRISLICGFSLIVLCLHIQRSGYVKPEDDYHNSADWVVVGLLRPLFALGLTMAVVPLLLAPPLWVQSLSDWPAWRIVGKLSFATAVVSLPVQRAMWAGEDHAFFWSRGQLAWDCSESLVLSLFFGTFVYFLVEVPAISLSRTVARM